MSHYRCAPCDAAFCQNSLTTCHCYIPFNRDPVSRTLNAVDVSLLNADQVTALWRPLASQTFTPFGRLPVGRIAASGRLHTALFVDQQPHRRTRGAICRTSMSTWKHRSSSQTRLLIACTKVTKDKLYRAHDMLTVTLLRHFYLC